MTGDKVSIRPTIKGINDIEDKSPAEQFQNTVLRPIIKMQHDLLVAFFHRNLEQKKVKFSELSASKKNELIATMFKNDAVFKTEVRGLIVGHFTIQEFELYRTMEKDLGKRILVMISERIQSLN